MSSKLISIIIPTYNRPKELYRALKSIKTHYSGFIEIIVCDDNSDIKNQALNTKVIEEYKSKNEIEIVYLLNKRNKGVSGARNSAIDISIGKWLLFLDDDDELNEGYLDLVYLQVNKNSNIDFFWANIYIKKNQSDKSTLLLKKFITNNEADLRNKVINIGISYGVCIKKECFIACDGFNESYFVGEDTELILNFLRHKFKFANINYPGVIKNEYEQNLLSKNLYKYASNHVVARLMKTYHNELSSDIYLYIAFITRGQTLYLQNKMFFTNIFFTISSIVRYKNIIKLLEVLIWKKKISKN